VTTDQSQIMNPGPFSEFLASIEVDDALARPATPKDSPLLNRLSEPEFISHAAMVSFLDSIEVDESPVTLSSGDSPSPGIYESESDSESDESEVIFEADSEEEQRDEAMELAGSDPDSGTDSDVHPKKRIIKRTGKRSSAQEIKDASFCMPVMDALGLLKQPCNKTCRLGNKCCQELSF